MRLNFFLYFTLALLTLGYEANAALPTDARQQTFQAMTKEVQFKMEMYAKNLHTKKWTYEIAAKDLICQAGSLMKLLMQRNNERYSHQKTDAELKEKIADELADTLSLVIFIADELDIDLTTAWQKMLESDKRKIQQRSTTNARTLI